MRAIATLAIIFAVWPFSASADPPAPTVSSGLLCNTAEQVLAVMQSTDNQAALKAVNLDAGKAVCVVGTVAFIEGPVIAIFLDAAGVSAFIRQNTVVAFSLDGGTTFQPVPPLDQFMPYNAEAPMPQPAGLQI